MDSRLSSDAGCWHITATTAYVGSWFGFVPNQDTIISALTGAADYNNITGSSKNFLLSMNIGGMTLKAGSYYAVAKGEVITGITLTSGGVVMYNFNAPN